MKREELQALGLTDEQINSVMASYGQAVQSTQSQLATAEQERDGYKGQVETITTQLEETKKGVTNSEELTKQVTDLQTQLAESNEKRESELHTTKLSYELDMALQASGAKNSKAVKALLDMDKVKFDDGKLTGLDDQLKALKENDDYMFNAEDTHVDDPNGGINFNVGGNPGSNGGSGNDDPFAAIVASYK